MARPLILYCRTVVALLRLLPNGLRNQVARSRYLAAPPPPSLHTGFLTTPTTTSTALEIGDMKFANEDKFAEKIQLELKNTRYACSALEPLSRGSSNFMFKGTLAQALEDGTTEVAVKHSEGFVAASPQDSMATSRCLVEKKSLETLRSLLPTLGSCIVRTPKLLHFSSESNTQVLEYLAASVDLKTYILKHFSATRDVSRKAPCIDLGTSIGTWLRSFHHWATLREQHAMQDIARSNEAMQRLKYKLYYERLVETIDDYPSILEVARRTFEDIRNKEAERLKDPKHLQAVHGDLWTGNAILRDAPLKKGASVFIIDWEFCQLGVPSMDLAQMLSELYQLYIYRDIEDAKWIIEGLVAGYGYIHDEFAFRTAIHIGAHLISFGSRMKEWGSETQIQEGVRIGRELIVRAWHEDRGWFEAGDLACLFVGRDQHHFAVG